MKLLKIFLSLAFLLPANAFGRTFTVENDTTRKIIVVSALGGCANVITPKKSRSLLNICSEEVLKKARSTNCACPDDFFVFAHNTKTKQYELMYAIHPKTMGDCSIKMSELSALVNNPNDKFDVCCIISENLSSCSENRPAESTCPSNCEMPKEGTQPNI